MQNRAEPKSRNTQYTSLKEYISLKEQPKKQQKSTHTKSNLKSKLAKSNNNSLSKLKPAQKTARHNENFNSINIVPQNTVKIKNAHHQVEHLKKESKKEDKSTRNSTERMHKSKSAVRLQPKSSRLSPCPAPHKDIHAEEKPKTQRNVVSRTDKEKKGVNKPKEGLKKSGSMVTILTKREHTDRERTQNRVSIKTEGSSKMNSVIRQDDRMKKTKKKGKGLSTKKEGHQDKKVLKNETIAKNDKKTKLQAKIQKSILYSEVSFQQFCQQHPFQSQLISTDKLSITAPGAKVKTQGYQPSIEESRFQERSFTSKSSAATKIQKVFRGYITRKYIEEAKYIINNVKKIQTWWRRLLLSRKQRKPRPLSIQSSLITIKDFNQSMKTQKKKTLSESKENTLSNNKLNIKELLRNVYQEHSDDERSIVIEKVPNSIEELQSPDHKTLTKQVYIEGKIKGEIISEKIFNSPKCINSPNISKTPTGNFAIKEFFNNSSQKQKIKEILHSPRLRSPPAPKATPKNSKGDQEFQIYHAPSEKVSPFETHFGAIQEFCLLLVNFFRDRAHHMSDFIEKTQEMKYYRTRMTLKNWNSYKLVEEPLFQEDDDDTLPLDYQFLQLFDRPAIFTRGLRDQILRFPEIEIQLNSKHFDLQGQKNKMIHRSFLQFIFDVLQQAFYQPHKYTTLEWKCSLSLLQFRDTQSYFENIFAIALGYIFNWGEVMAGIMLDNQEEQEQQRQNREKIMEKRVQHWDLGMGSRLGIKVEVSEGLVQELVEEMVGELVRLSM